MGRGGRGGGGGSRGSSGGGSRGSRGRVGGGGRGGYNPSGSYSRSHGGYNRSGNRTYIHIGGSGYRGGGLVGWVGPIMGGMLILFLIYNMLSMAFSWNVTASTVHREPIPVHGAAVPGYDDELGWIRSSDKLMGGMRRFYDETGVIPYLYITDTLEDGSVYATADNLESTAMAKYDEVFDGENGLVLLFHEHNSDSNYSTWAVTGKATKSVMDDEAVDILLDYVDAYYYSDMDEDEMFADVFADAGKRIMHKSVQPVHVLLVLVSGGAVICVIVLGRKWWLEKQKRDAEKARETERILNADLDRFGEVGPDTSELEGKYSAASGSDDVSAK